MKVELPSHLKTTLKYLDEKNLDYDILGGFCRDSYLCKNYSDIDIFIYVSFYDVDKVTKYLEDFDFIYQKHVFDSSIQDRIHYTKERIPSYISDFRKEDINIILISKEETPNKEIFLDTFDFNLNQFYYDFDTSSVRHINGWTPNDIVTVVNTEYFNFTRFLKFIKKYPELKWFTYTDFSIIKTNRDAVLILADYVQNKEVLKSYDEEFKNKSKMIEDFKEAYLNLCKHLPSFLGKVFDIDADILQ